MPNPFDDEEATFVALVNDEGQFSLWPAFAAIPAGWRAVLEEATRMECLEYIRENWSDMRPASLAQERKERDRAALSERVE